MSFFEHTARNTPRRLQILHILLKVQEGFAHWMVAAQNKVLNTIVTNDSAPKSIV